MRGIRHLLKKVIAMGTLCTMAVVSVPLPTVKAAEEENGRLVLHYDSVPLTELLLMTQAEKEKPG
ncbi:hypothetical protein [Clostridium sp. C105KSO13]|uniref:hypothetical protein n=1 Tax=Clostridium sp. C105KSO13 TaxID=1776045 RepID=UPI00074087A2|nr:hypothetical protein [Clostridium sp. C105KSO13]CUX47127.1 hypothetical protein BN3456_02643 [Clostridium sp. C105KSO13]